MWKPINISIMKKLISFLITVLQTINLHGQGIDQFIGKYSVTDIWSQVSGFDIIRIDTSFYEINIVKYTDTLIAISSFAAIDTVKATVDSDSFYIFLQKLYYNEWNIFTFRGSGKFYGDTVKYQYESGGTRGGFNGSCIGIKVNGNSINNLLEKNKSLIDLFSIDNGLLQLQLKSNFSGEIILYTPDGKQVLKKPVTNKESTICTPANGLLLYRFITEKGEVQSGRVVVQ
jgi:hypothetical protein